jgi:hypothetical protein
MVRCLCCGQVVTKRRLSPVTEDEALRAYVVLAAQGHTVDSLRITHRENLDYVWPGFTDWLDRIAGARPPSVPLQ